MSNREAEFYQRLLATFKVEAAEHLQSISDGLLALESAGSAEERAGIIETIFREAHSLKGAARAVNLREIEAVCQPLESLLAAWKSNGFMLAPEVIDLVYRTVTALESLIASSQGELSPAQGAQAKELAKLLGEALESRPKDTRSLQGVGEIRLCCPPETPEGQEKPAKPAEWPEAAVTGSQPAGKFLDKPGLVDTVRVATGKLDALLLQAEELIAAKLIAGQRAADLRESYAEFAGWQKKWAKMQPQLRLAAQVLSQSAGEQDNGGFSRAAGNFLDFLEYNAEFMKNLQNRLSPLVKAAAHDHRVIGGLVDNLLENMKTVLMLPFSALLETFPRFVRDLAKEQGKEIDLLVQGGEVEIDRRILHEIKDPLLHLVRNSIDHGQETPAERVRKNKPVRGQLTITIAQKDSGKVEICVADDGIGIDPEKVKAATLKQGLLTPEEAAHLSPEEARRLIFRSGVSTAPIISTISGRGLGLAIVQEKVEKLGGTLLLETLPEGGTIFRLILPLTLATFRGALIQVGQRIFVIPTTNLERVARVKSEDIKTIGNRETIPLSGRSIALVSLAEVLDLPLEERSAERGNFLTVLVLSGGGQSVAFEVDGVLNEQEVLVKNLGKQLLRVPNIAGATVLGTGAVAPILNVGDLLKSAVKARAGTHPQLKEHKTNGEQQTKAILVAEDSITARTLLKNILELAGYRVETAVDGVNGFTALQKGNFDLVVSDVEMPRLNGFELTAKIRGDKRLAEIPVVLVTALESPEDRQQGIEVGANAYIVKSSFDQGNLLDLIQRLI